MRRHVVYQHSHPSVSYLDYIADGAVLQARQNVAIVFLATYGAMEKSVAIYAISCYTKHLAGR